MSAGAEQPLEGLNPTHERLLRQFEHEHLPDELRELSAPFHTVACHVVVEARRKELHPADVTVALRKLLEAKDAFVRARLD